MEHSTKAGVVVRGSAVALTLALAAGAVPMQATVAYATPAPAATATAEGAVSLDKDNLANGTYSVPVRMLQAADLSAPQGSIANSALDPVGSLTVKDGAYTLKLNMNGQVLGEYCNYLGYYASYRVEDNALVTSGRDVALRDFDGEAGQPFTADVPLGEVAKDSGYVAVSLGAQAMGESHQRAAVLIDWSGLTVDRLDDAAQPLGALLDEAAAIQQGNKGEEAYRALQEAVALARAVVEKGAAATPQEVAAAEADLKAAVQAFNESADAVDPVAPENPSAETPVSAAPAQPAPIAPEKPVATAPEKPAGKAAGGSASATAAAAQPQPSAASSGAEYVAGHTYAVPMKFFKTNSGDLSMADQYFGDTAYVVPRSDGMFEVRFTTNRSDYVEKLSYGGSEASAVSESGTNRTYGVVIAASKDTVVLPITMTIKPMREMGGGDVSADLHLYLGDANVKDLGSGNAGAPTSGKTGNSPAAASAQGSTLPKTGDNGLAGAAGAVAVAAGAVAAGVATRRRLSVRG